ncbi:MAG: hypothetical protein SFT93_01520 [Rickettsiaceae bacterium]|nr:hypothetical protein [Rickettsiaceae bacterium]
MAKRKLSDPQSSSSAAASIASSSLPGASKHSSLADTSSSAVLSSYSPLKIQSSFETYQMINDTLQERYADPTLDVIVFYVELATLLTRRSPNTHRLLSSRLVSNPT